MKRSTTSVPILVTGLLAVTLLIGAPPAAEAGPRPNYAAFRAGFYVPGSGDLGGKAELSGADAGPFVEGAYGRYLGPNVAIEAGIGTFSTEAEFGGVYNDTITVVPVTVTVKGVFPAGGVEPYVGGGIGLYFVDHESENPYDGFTWSDDDTAIGLHIGGGVNVDISPLVYVGGEIRYRFLKATTFDRDIDLGGLTATAHVGFRF